MKSRISEKGKPQFDTALIQCIKREGAKKSNAEVGHNENKIILISHLNFYFVFHFFKSLRAHSMDPNDQNIW